MLGSLRAIAVAGLTLALASTAHAAPGVLDASFSGDGRVSVSAAASFVVRAVAVQPDGRILAGGYTCEPGPSRSGLCAADGDSSFRIARFTPGGDLDPGFGDRGLVTVAVGEGRSQIFDLLLLPDGSLLAGGVARHEGRDSFALARFDERGALQAVTFTPAGSGFSAIADLAPAPGGKVIAVGQALDHSLPARGRIAIARYDSRGQPDRGFGAFGTVLAGTTTYGYGLGAWVAPDGAVMAAGIAGTGPDDVAGHRTGIVRVTPMGLADARFSGDGAAGYVVGATSSFANAVTGLPDGRWLSAGTATDGEGRQVMALVRGTAAGELDPSWDGDGVALVRTLAGSAAADVERLPDSRVLAAGHADGGLDDVRFALARLDASGRLDPAFGGGVVTTTWPRFPVARATALAVDSSGRTVVAGVGCSGGAGAACAGGTAHLVLARFEADSKPRDARAPVIAIIPPPRAYRRGTLIGRGLLMRVRPDEVARVSITLRAQGRRVGRRALPFGAGRRSVRVAVRRRRLPGRPFTLRVVIRATDRAGNVATLRRALRVR